MSFSARSWLLALGLAITTHGLVFLVANPPANEAKIERSAGPKVTISGSLSALATQMEAVTSQQAVEPIKAEAVTMVKPLMQVAAIEPVATQAVISAQKVKPEKPKPLKKVEIKKQLVKKKVKMARLVQKKLLRKKIEKKRRATKLRKKAKAKAKAKTKANRKGGRMAAVRRGGGGRGRQSKVSGKAKLSNYKGRVRARVAGRAHSSGGRGSAIVSFTVTSSGGVRAISVSGGNSAHKNAARRAARGGFPPIPRGVGRTAIRFTVRINFR